MGPTETNLLELSKIFFDDEASFSYLLKRLREEKRLVCTNCNSKDFYSMSRFRLKCKLCRHEFRPMAQTGFSKLNVTLSNWLTIVNLFALGYTAMQAAERVKASYKTTLKAFHVIQQAVVQALLKRDAQLHRFISTADTYELVGRSGIREGRSLRSIPVYAVLEEEEKVIVGSLKGVSAEAIMGEDDVEKANSGAIVYTDRWRGYDTVLFHGARFVRRKRGYRFACTEIFVDKYSEFWDFAKDRLARSRGLDQEKFFLLLKEVEWRYNHRDEDLFGLIIGCMLDL